MSRREKVLTHGSGVAEGFPYVAGCCPACGQANLFVGAAGYVTCSWIDCSDPGAASKALGA